MALKNIAASPGIILFMLVTLCTRLPLRAQDKPNGEDVIRNMYARYHGKLYTDISFEQNSAFYKDHQLLRNETWFEAAKLPGQLLIRFDSANSANGLLFKDDSVYRFREGALVRSSHRIHELVLLCFDIYFYKPGKSIDKLHQLGFNTSAAYRKTMGSKKVIVLGASSEKDTSANQFMVDEEQLVVIGVYMKEAGKTRVVEMDSYRMIGKYPVATEILFYVNGELNLRETYSRISFNKQPAELFEPAKFPKGSIVLEKR